METLVVMTAVVMADTLPTCSLYCETFITPPWRWDCDCRSILAQNIQPLRFKRQDHDRPSTSNSQHRMPLAILKRRRTRRNTHPKNAKVSDEIHGEKNPKLDTKEIFDCINLLNIVMFKRKYNDTECETYQQIHDNNNCNRSEIELMEEVNEKCTQTITNTNIPDIKNISDVVDSTFNDLNNVGMKKDDFSDVTFDKSSKFMKLIKEITITVRKYKHIVLIQSHTSKNVSSNELSTASIPSPPVIKYYKSSTKTTPMKDNTINITLQPKEPYTEILRTKDYGELSYRKLASTSKNNKATNTFLDNTLKKNRKKKKKKPSVSLKATTDYSKMTNKNFTIKKQSSDKMRKQNKGLTKKNTEAYPNRRVNAPKNIDVNIHKTKKAELLVPSKKPIKENNDTANQNSAKLFANSSLKFENNTALFKKSQRQQYNESEIPIIKVISREYRNDTVSSIINGTETLPNDDFKEQKNISSWDYIDFMIPMTDVYKIFRVPIHTSHADNLFIPKATEEKSKDLNIKGKLYFLVSHKNKPASFVEEPYSILQISLDMLDICNKPNRHNQSPSIILSILCNWVQLTKCIK